jgi:hypothetical protein
MYYLIEIDKESIKKNPNVGYCGPYNVPGIIQKRIIEGRVCEISRTIESVYTISPEPKYFWKYLDCLVTCKYCGYEFSYTKLETEDWETEDGEEVFKTEMCPFCNKAECCEIEYQKIEEAIEETI